MPTTWIWQGGNGTPGGIRTPDPQVKGGPQPDPQRAVLATALAGFFLPIEALAAVEFKTIQDPAFVGRGPGPDGFVGTADDVLDPNNTAGTVAYAISSQLLFLYSEATTTINEPFVFENGRSIVTDFTTSGSLVPGFSFTDDLTAVIPGISLPHEMWTDLQGRTDGEYYLIRCTGGRRARHPSNSPFDEAKTRTGFPGSTLSWRATSTS